MNFTESAKGMLSRGLLKTGWRPTPSTDPALITDFLKSVRPISTNHSMIRVGGDGDGGYLVPDDLEGVQYCFSPGVSNVADFENELTQRGIKCFLADYSVDAPPIRNELFNFEKRYLGTMDDAIYMTLESWVERNARGDGDLLLQMDIEGNEFDVIFDTSPDTLRRFRILVIEFHRLDVLFDKYGFRLVSLVFKKLLRDFDVVHIHPNNAVASFSYRGIEIPPMMEFTFLRKDRILARQLARSFPHLLDRKNAPQSRDILLPKCWYEC